MKKIVALGIYCVIGAEIVTLATVDRRWVPIASGVVAGLTLLAVFWYRMAAAGPDHPHRGEDDRTAQLHRWLSRTEIVINRAGSTRREWDRHLRPMLARQFELATGERHNRDRAAYVATGRMLFGPRLWSWVDPDNVARTGGDEPGPGCAALDEILARLERV